ncbi:MAG: bifunctional proline dehydrogenase/L-glutamate gamma-semialdehyde dehydrogenase PutA [Candidatus Paracaedibacteraceae bacterium]|nr:bifunctional proline dehydrogenase/L-glutamate gamma-semialdehyde dehydrogenase PutA [Candidatus Paracaedibacteraceae bacterium]
MTSSLQQKLNSFYRIAENDIVPQLLVKTAPIETDSPTIRSTAEKLVSGVRSQKLKAISIENFLQTYDLGSQEGLALMCLAEAYLRVPDLDTQTALIKDKVGSVDWAQNIGKANSLLVNLATLGLSTTDSVLHWGLDKNGFTAAIGSVTRKLSEPVIRTAVGQAMKILGHQFVLGESINDALKKAASAERRGYRHSYDMLGEGAKTAADAERYFQSYQAALEAIATCRNGHDIYGQPSISVKLSAIHPRYELLQKDRVFAELYPKVLALCLAAKKHDIALTIDAEESDRLEISLEIIDKLSQEPELKEWNGLGLAVQAYQKRAYAVIEYLIDLGKTHNRRLCVRLVKGAYWDMEIKKTQERGLSDYPVFTRKVNTDVSYFACADLMLKHTKEIYPQFATHNAYTAAAIMQLAKKYNADFEFQRLHGMGEKLYAQIVNQGIPCRIYAPVGEHKDLLAYLVRRLLENGANSSFVNKIHDPATPIEELLMDPLTQAKNHDAHHNDAIPYPKDMLQPSRVNSRGFDLGDSVVVAALEEYVAKFANTLPLTNSITPAGGKVIKINDPANPEQDVSITPQLNEQDLKNCLDLASAAYPSWSKTTPSFRAKILETLAKKLDENYEELMAILIYEGGKTYADTIAEIREAIDFCTYYANQARSLMGMAIPLPGPTGERNELSLHGRGVVACISPWNFPLAIFLGQIAAALVTGNTVLAKPAQQTPTIARRAIELAYEAGVPRDVLHYCPSSGKTVGDIVLTDSRIAGVAFTGSTDVAWTINQTLAARRSAITPLIAETGGINAMIVDSSALTEQVVSDIIISAFQSAGQRCSALRLLFLQDDIADKTIEMLKGAVAELKLGHTSQASSDIGCVIDANAQKELQDHVDWLKDNAQLLIEAKLPPSKGSFFAPQAWLLSDASQLNKEVFGPIVHIVRFKANELANVIDTINNKGFGLTLGLHSRIEETVDFVRQHAHVGNFYVNRSMIGAVVGVQPFGGEGLSGTGPKAGGPHYLLRFVHERTFTQDTTAAGGNATLLASVG